MPLDWNIEPEDGQERDVPARTHDEAGPVRRSLGLRILPVACAALVLLLVLLGGRALQNHRILRQAESELRLAVALEEQALADGDAELYLGQQEDVRRRRLRMRASYAEGAPPPLPGLFVTGPSEIVEVRALPPEAGQGGEIGEAEVRVRYPVSDTLGSGLFEDRRIYRRAEDGVWRHAAGPGIREDLDERFQGRYLRAVYAAEDKAYVLPALERVEEELDRVCKAGGCPGSEAQVLRFGGALPGRAHFLRHDGERALSLPSPARTLIPADEAAEALLARQIQRLAVLVGLDAAREVAADELMDDRLPWTRLRRALLDAWLRPDEGAPGSAPERQPAPLTESLDDVPASAWDLWVAWNPSETAELGWQARAAEAFVMELVQERGLDPLALFKTMESPSEQGLVQWLSANMDRDEAWELALSWPGEAAAMPMDDDLLLLCYLDRDGLAFLPRQLLFRPGATSPEFLDAKLCGDDVATWAAWSPSGDALAARCEDHGSRGRGPAESARLQVHDPEPPWTIRSALEIGESSAREPTWIGDERILIYEDRAVQVVDVRAERPVPTVLGAAEGSWTATGVETWSHDGAQAARLESDGTGGEARIALYDTGDPASPRWTKTVSPPHRDRVAIAFDPSGRHLAIVNVEGPRDAGIRVEILDTRSGALLRDLFQGREALSTRADIGLGRVDARSRLLFAGYDDGGEWLALSVGLVGPNPGLGALVLAWRPELGAPQDAEDDDISAKTLPEDGAGYWLPERHPRSEAPGPSLVLFTSSLPSQGGPSRTKPLGILRLSGGTYELIDRMPAGISPDGAWLFRNRFGRFELRDREDRSEWAFNAPGCRVHWRRAER